VVLAGSVAISSSSLFVRLSDTGPTTASLFRCLLGLVVLLPLALAECRRVGLPNRRTALAELGAGAMLGLDLLLWSQAILDLGAGIATVLVNVQVIVVPVLGRLAGEKLPPRFLVLIPIMLSGVTLASGVIGADVSGSHVVRGTLCGVAAGVAYGGYLTIMRRGGASAHRMTPVALATVGATVVASVAGLFLGDLNLTPGWAAFGWLCALALSGQVVGWLLVTAGMRRLDSSVGATLLLLQPVLAVGFGMLILGERPDVWQLLGCAVVIGALWTAARKPKPKAGPLNVLPPSGGENVHDPGWRAPAVRGEGRARWANGEQAVAEGFPGQADPSVADGPRHGRVGPGRWPA
jgi:drug/metabolite transporter (DMT)-like permease